MSVPFNAHRGLVHVYAEVAGHAGVGIVRLALDTGAIKTVINHRALVGLGYEPAASGETTEVTTASGVERVPLLPIRKIRALGREQRDFPVLCHTLPPRTGVDGLLGLDFLRGYILTVDFPKGRITLSAPSSAAS